VLPDGHVQDGHRDPGERDAPDPAVEHHQSRERERNPHREVLGGTAISRGLGRCSEVAFRKQDPDPVEARLDTLNEAWSEIHEDEEGVLVSLTLGTPALFADPYLRPETSPGAGALLQAPLSEEENDHARALSSLESVHQVARPERFEAWNGLSGFPHATDQGLAAGSALLFRAPDLTDDLLSALAHLEHAGVGLRRHLGLGRVRVCAPVHTLTRQQQTNP
jgi:hypothetical protein